MDVQQILEWSLVTAAFILLLTLGKRISKIQDGRRVTSQKLKPLPGPLCLPYIGSLFQIGVAAGRGQLFEQYHSICKTYGRIMGTKVGCLNIAVVEDYATARAILSSGDWTSRFPPTEQYRGHTFGKNLGLLFSHGDEWKEMRKFVIKTLREFGFGELSIAEQFLENELTSFMEHFEYLRLRSKNALQMNGLFKIPLVNIIWRIVMGVRLEYGDPEALKIIRLIESATAAEFGLHPYFAFPWLKQFPGMNPVKSVKDSLDQFHIYLRKILDERRQNEACEAQNQTNFMDRIIQQIEFEKQNSDTIYTDEQLLVLFGDILGASLDTTSNSFEFAVLYMAKYPEVQKKVQAELDNEIGRNRMPHVYDRLNLPYTEATMLETLRHANVVPVTPRTSTCDTALGEYHVPQDTFCMLNLTIIHMDEMIWGDPTAFRPERFLDQSNRVIKDHKLLAFGAGKRLCIGHTMAKVTWMTFFAALLQKYSFEVSEDYPDLPMKPISGFTNTARTFYCNVKLR